MNGIKIVKAIAMHQANGQAANGDNNGTRDRFKMNDHRIAIMKMTDTLRLRFT